MARGGEVTPRKRRAPEVARREILDAAVVLFAERGFDGVAVTDVARAAGMSHALVLHYFGTFDDLVAAAVREGNVAVARDVMAQLGDLDAPIAPGRLLARVVTAMRSSSHGRLFAWALLTGRAVRGRGLTRVADAVEARIATECARTGRPPPTRARVEQALLIGLCAVVGHVVGGDAFARGFGLEPESARAAFDDTLAELLMRALQ
jgi:AcrR family transcriptional regulator